MKTKNTIIRVGIIAIAMLCCVDASAQNNRRRGNQNRRSVPAKEVPPINRDSLVDERQMRSMDDLEPSARVEYRTIEAARAIEAAPTPPAPEPPPLPPPTNKVFDVVENPPSFPGGQAALRQWLSENIKYPAIAEENNIQGRVVVTFVIETDGSIGNIRVVKSVDPSLDEEAVRLVEAMPKWTPGTQNDKPVRVRYNLPLTFKLSDPEPKEGGNQQ